MGCPPPQPTRGCGEHRKLPQRGPGPSPGRKTSFGLFRAWKNTPVFTSPDFSLTFSIFPDFSLTTLEFPDFSRFSRWVVTLYVITIDMSMLLFNNSYITCLITISLNISATEWIGMSSEGISTNPNEHLYIAVMTRIHAYLFICSYMLIFSVCLAAWFGK